VQNLPKSIASCRTGQKFLCGLPNGSVLRIRKEAAGGERQNLGCEKQGVSSLRGALERSLASGKVVCVVVPDVGTAIRHLRRIWAGKVDCAHIEGGADVWGWTRDTPKNELDFRLILKGRKS